MKAAEKTCRDASREFRRTLCLCNSNIPWGGGEQWHFGTAVSFAGRGWRVLLLCHPDGELYKRAAAYIASHDDGPDITLVPMPVGRLSFLNPFLRSRLTAFLKKECVDSVIMNLPADVKAVAPAARAAGVAHIVYRRGSALPVKDSALNRWLYGKVITRLIVNSEATKRQVLAKNAMLIPEDRITVLPNGIDIDRFDAALAAAQPLALAGHTEGELVLGNAGRLARQKGQHILLYLCRELERAGVPCRLVIAGEGERRTELETLASNLQVADRVQFVGFMKELSKFWKSIDVFVLSSLWEGFGYVLVEAMLAEKPVVAFSVSNIPELVRDGDNGRLFPVPAEDAQESPEGDAKREGSLRAEPYVESLGPMVGALKQLWQNRHEISRLGTAGRKFALGFSQERCMDTLERLLKQQP